MKILFIVPYTPNFIRVRPYQLISALLQRQHQVTVATLWANEDERADLARLRALGATVIAQPAATWRSLLNTIGALPTRLPLQAVYSWEPALARALRELLQTQTFDVIHVEHLRGARYGLYVKALQRQQPRPTPVIWDSVDCISHLFEQAAQGSRSLKGRLLTRLDLKRTQRYEGQLTQQFDQVLVTSATDKQALEHLAQRAGAGRSSLVHLHVVPNGVDLAYFAPNDKARAQATLVFSGKMSYHANVTAVLHLVNDIMPQVWGQDPAVKVWIVGKDPTPEVRALTQHPAAPLGAITVTGTVPDLRPYLQQATIAVAPIPYGAGIQNKVLEAMACASPVIASPQARSALQDAAEPALVVAPNAPAFAEAIRTLLDQPERCAAMGQAGRRYVESHHAWRAMAARLETIYQAAIQDKRVLASHYPHRSLGNLSNAL